MGHTIQVSSCHPLSCKLDLSLRFLLDNETLLAKRVATATSTADLHSQTLVCMNQTLLAMLIYQAFFIRQERGSSKLCNTLMLKYIALPSTKLTS